MPSHKQKRRAKQQARLDNLNPAVLNAPRVSIASEPTPEAAAAAASLRQDIMPRTWGKESPIVVVAADETMEARKAEVNALKTFAETTGLKPAAEEMYIFLVAALRRPRPHDYGDVCVYVVCVGDGAV